MENRASTTTPFPLWMLYWNPALAVWAFYAPYGVYSPLSLYSPLWRLFLRGPLGY